MLSPHPFVATVTVYACVVCYESPRAASLVSWNSIRDHGHATPVFRNSHSTAIARLVQYHGLKKPNESPKTLIATCWIYAQYCACDEPGDPILWRIPEGVSKLFTARGHPKTPIRERCRYSGTAGDRADWADYMAAIDRDEPVILTLCYDPAARQGLPQAKRRVSKCFSVVGIGYMTQNGQKLLICHDGLTEGQKCEASADRAEPSKLGIESKGKPWGEPGTALYKWDGSYTNVVMVFVGKPAK